MIPIASIRPIGELVITATLGLVVGTVTGSLFGGGAGVIALLGVIATVDLAQFALVVDHRERLVSVEHEVKEGNEERRASRAD